MATLSLAVSNTPPDQLDLEQALRRLFPGFEPSEGHPPGRSWTSGQRPNFNYNLSKYEHLKPIDDLIYKYVSRIESKSNKSISIRSINELEKFGVSCPYYYVRLGIAYSVLNARLSTNKDIYFKNQIAKIREEIINKIQFISKNIDDFIFVNTPQYLSSLSTPSGRYGNVIKSSIWNENLIEAKDLFENMISVVEKMNNMSSKISLERSRYIKRGDPNVWLISFSTSIGRLWTELTGCDVRPNSRPFAEFITHCYTAIGGDRSEWKRTLETCLSAKPQPSELDKHHTVVPPRELLLCEATSDTKIDSAHTELIGRALEWDEGCIEKILALCEDGTLPVSIAALVRRIPWSVESFAQEALGLDAETIRKSIADLKERGVI